MSDEPRGEARDEMRLGPAPARVEPVTPSSRDRDPVSTYDMNPYVASPADPLQFTLAELAQVILGVSLGLALGRWLPGKIVSLALGLGVLVGWCKLYIEDWEPRWGAVLWFAALGAYLGAAAMAVARAWV